MASWDPRNVIEHIRKAMGGGRMSGSRYNATPNRRGGGGTFGGGPLKAGSGRHVNYAVPSMNLSGHTVVPRTQQWSGHMGPGGAGASREATAIINAARGGGKQLYGGGLGLPSGAGSVGSVDTGVSGGPANPVPAPPPGLSTAERNKQLEDELNALLGLEFDPRKREAERMLEMLGITRGQTQDYFNQFQRQGTGAINEVYGLVGQREQGLRGDLEKFLNRQANMMTSGALGTATAEGLGETPLGDEFAREIAKSAMTESQANAGMRAAQYTNFMKALQDTGAMQRQDVSQFQAQTGADMAEQLQTLLGEELGGRRELRDIETERGQTAVALRRELERDIAERERQGTIDALQAEEIRGRLGLSREELRHQIGQDLWGRGMEEKRFGLESRLTNAQIDQMRTEIEKSKKEGGGLSPSMITALNQSGMARPVVDTLQYAISTKTGSDVEGIYKRFQDNMEARRKRGEVTYEQIAEGTEFLGKFLFG